MKDSWKRYHVQIVVAGCVILLLASLVVMMRRWPHGTSPGEESSEVPQTLTEPDTGKIGLPAVPESRSSSPVTGSEEPGKPAGTANNAKPPEREHPDYSPATVSGRVDSWEDWNLSFSDSISRTYSAIFDNARLDTVSGGRLVFSATGRQKDFLTVKRVFCSVDSVKPLVKYTFPGQSVDFVIGVGFAAGISLRGRLDPQQKTCELEQFNPERESISDESERMRNQFIVLFNSTPGYAYLIRTGIECAYPGEERYTKTYYTRPAAVEFRRMVRYATLARDAGDTVLILTANPKAIEDLSRVVRRSLIEAVFVPVSDPDEAEALQKEQLPNVRLHISLPRVLDRSFVVLNDSEALIEQNVLDPDFRHTVQLKLKEAQMSRIGYPRITHLSTDASAVLELKFLFRHFEKLVSP
jgi:hypothetical protein